MGNVRTKLLAVTLTVVSGFTISCSPSDASNKTVTEPTTVELSVVEDTVSDERKKILDRKYSDSSYYNVDMPLIKLLLPKEEFETISGQIMMEFVFGDGAEGVSYRELLERARLRETKNREIEELKEQSQREQASRVNPSFDQNSDETFYVDKSIAFNYAVTVTCIDKGYATTDEGSFITLLWLLGNNTDKDISSIKGKVSFMENSTDEIFSVGLTYNESVIHKGNKRTYDSAIKYGVSWQNMAFENRKLEDLTVVWQPEKIVFTDGTFIE